MKEEGYDNRQDDSVLRKGGGGYPRRRKGRFMFERHPSRVVYDPSAKPYGEFVVSWAKCTDTDEYRLANRRAPRWWIPSACAVADLLDRGVVTPERAVAAANAIAAALDAGDAAWLDTDGAKAAASIVESVAEARRETGAQDEGKCMDAWMAVRDLSDEVSMIRLRDEREEDFSDEAMSVLLRAARECEAVEGFASWSRESMRKRFLYCLKTRERTDAACSVVSAYFGVGACPVLTTRDRGFLVETFLPDTGFSYKSFSSFAGEALRAMSEARADVSGWEEGAASRSPVSTVLKSKRKADR